MVDFGTPYAVDGSAIPGAGLRRQLQRDAGAGSGVCRSGDLRVSALDVPGAGVKIAAGDDVVQCRAPGRDRESYGTPLASAQDYLGDAGTGIPGTGSGAGRRDMIIHEIVDPSLPRTYTPRGQIPEGVYSKISVVPGVPAGAKRVEDVPALNEVTAYALAAITWPASTGTIVEAMIEDLRTVHRPRRERMLFTRFPAGYYSDGTAHQIPTGASYAAWPLRAAECPEIEIPEWATRVTVTCFMQGIYFSQSTARAVAGVLAGLTGLANSQNTIIIEDNNSSAARHFYAATGVQEIPAALRGTVQRVQGQARRTEGSGLWWADYQSTILLDVEFVE